MIKIKNKNFRTPLIILGYTLFALLVVSVIVSTTIPFSLILLHPKSLKLNVIISMLALTIGAVLPILIGYFIGGHSIKSKSKISQHFNAILFGLLAYWVMTSLAVFMPIPSQIFPDNNVRIVLANIIPSIMLVAIAATLSITHMRSKKASHDILEYKPFATVLITLIIAMPVVSLFNNITNNNVSVFSFLSLIIIILIGLTSFCSLQKTQLNIFHRMTWSAVSISVLFVMIYIFNILESGVVHYLVPYPTMESQTVSSIITSALAFVGWLLYWLKQTRALNEIKIVKNK